MTIQVEDLKRAKLVDVANEYSDYVQQIAKENNIVIQPINAYIDTQCSISDNDMIDPIYITAEVGSTIVSNFIGNLVCNFAKGVL